ncbi:glycosyltransferase [Falsiroseomonas sp.]|uniref:glycosyltransferase n=1 Tax=Falsiroseomonas sp. TaxID=2870721 RepID=UPI003F70C6C5
MAMPAPMREPGGRHVLLLEFDLYHRVGGGQSTYRRIITGRPQDTFYYFARREPADAPRPGNAIAIPYARAWQVRPEMGARGGHLLSQYVECRNLAASVAAHAGRQHFDVADGPDYSQHTLFIRQALAAEGIELDTVAVALHGTLSSAFAAGWPGAAGGDAFMEELRQREELQFRAADARYAISESYAAEWQDIADLPVNILDPLCIVDPFTPVAAPKGTAPELLFVGRREKWKGPDIFLDLAWCIDPAAYGSLHVVGPDGPNRQGVGSAETLAGIARRRALKPTITDGLPPAELRTLFRGRTVLMLPSRHDTFNLTALEALGQGCVVMASDRSGYAHWLHRRLPELDWSTISLDCSRTTASQVEAVLRDYDRHRGLVLSALSRAAPRADRASLGRIWTPGATMDGEARQTVVDLAARFAMLADLREPSLPRRAMLRTLETGLSTATTMAARVPGPLRKPALKAARGAAGLWRLRHRASMGELTKERIKTRMRELTGVSPRTLQQIVGASSLPRFRRSMFTLPEATPEDIKAKIAELSREIPWRLVDRVRLFRELASLERRQGNDLIAATYMLRIIRWLGEDRTGDLPFVTATLAANGFKHEAATAHAMFGLPMAERDAACAALMKDAFDRNRAKARQPLAILDDPRRPGHAARVAVIVSLYNASDKLPTLLDNLAQQSLARAGGLEIILVDSNSPKDEGAALRRWQASRRSAIPIVYARSAGRETIQAAWNRGIHLARAPYLSFLGADEGLHPEALTKLAAALDRDPGVDWAMADSVVTSVDEKGVFDADVMPYDRTGYSQDLVYLETCYLSWVGGLYRRSIHERFGFYDETYRAAGDTEFKNRVMPHIRSVHVPEMLGVFNNYPEERTTQHPRAEIEDLRAWYLWRTPAGMDYAFAHRPVEQAIALLRASFSYRKSYCGHLSTDFELAESLALHLMKRGHAPAFTRGALEAAREALAEIRSVELLPDGIMGRAGMTLHTSRAVRRLRRQMPALHQAALTLANPPWYEIFNDNRYEQHWYSWSG